MHEGIFIGIDAGTSQIKCVAFSAAGEEIASTTCVNEYDVLPNGCVEQDAHITRQLLLTTLTKLVSKLGKHAERVVALAITAMGDGMLLVDADGQPLQKGWLWLDSRAADIVTELENQPCYEDIFRLTGTALNASQMRSQMRWMEKNKPAILDKAHAALHWKDYLYYCLTGVTATDPSEALFTYGSFDTGEYDEDVLGALGLSHRANLLPSIVDGMHDSHTLLPEIAINIGLKSVPVTLGYVDVICSALGGGLYNNGEPSAMTIMGTTGIHMRYAGAAKSIQLPEQKTGYTIAFPGGGFVQLQTNMAATLNIDWILKIGADAIEAYGHDASIESMLESLDDKVLNAKLGAALFHPYISNAGERGPFFNANARASFDGLEQSCGYFDLVRAVIEGMCFAARDCYQSLGEIPDEIRLTGGAAKSTAVQIILASILNRPVRVAELQESGAAGAVMIATVKHGVFASLDECTQTWLGNKLADAIYPDAMAATKYDALFELYLHSRQKRITSGLWEQWASVNNQHDNTAL